MRVLFLGGTGIISSGCIGPVLEAGHELTVLNRGRTSVVPLPPEVRVLPADLRDESSVREAVGAEQFDVVVQWIGFVPEHVEQDLRVFADAGQYVFISSATVYEKSPRRVVLTEDMPRANPHWQYARDKIACEDVLFAAHAERDFPATVVRPSHTYGDSLIPVALNSDSKPWTIVDRMRRGRPVLVPGDGSGVWTVTHNSDFASGFVPLLGHPEAVGEAFHITGDEVLTWDEIHCTLAEAAGVEARLLHVPTDALAAADPDWEEGLRGDKSLNFVFDTAKLRRLAPGFATRTRFAEGIRRTVAWFEADAARRDVDEEMNATWDAVAEVYEHALEQAARV